MPTTFNQSEPDLQAWINGTSNSTQTGQIRGIPNFFSKSMFGKTSNIKDASQFLVVAAMVAMVLRAFSRRRIKTNMGWDDGCAIVATVFLIANQLVFSVIDYLGVHSFSFVGRFDDAAEEHRLAQIVIGLKLSLAFEVMYLISIFLVKFSMLFLYERFARHTKHITLYLRITQGICFITFAVCVLSLFLSCIPINMFWNLYQSNVQCSKRILLTYTSGISNIITNTLVLAVPVPLLLRANLTSKQKIGLFILYFFGAFVIVASALRFATQLLDVSVPQAMGWSQMEISLALILSCAPMAVKLLLMPLVDPKAERERIAMGKRNTVSPDIMPETITRMMSEKYSLRQSPTSPQGRTRAVSFGLTADTTGPQRMDDPIPMPARMGTGLTVDTSRTSSDIRTVREMSTPDYHKLKLVRREETNGQSVWEVRPVSPTSEV